MTIICVTGTDPRFLVFRASKTQTDVVHPSEILFCFFPGKILSDDTALKEYKIDEKNFVVVMVTKVGELQTAGELQACLEPLYPSVLFLYS